MSNKAILCIWRINNETHKLEVLLTQRRWARWGMGQLFFDFQENDFSDETVHLRWPFMTQEERDLLSGTAQELWDHPMIPCNWRLTPEMSPMFSTRFAFTSEITRSHDNHTSNAAPLAFTFPGGRPDREEDSQEAAIREFVEETEIDRQDILLDTVMEISDFGWGVSFFIGQLKDICQAVSLSSFSFFNQQGHNKRSDIVCRARFLSGRRTTQRHRGASGKLQIKFVSSWCNTILTRTRTFQIC